MHRRHNMQAAALLPLAVAALFAFVLPVPATHAQSMMALCERDVPAEWHAAEIDFCNTIGQAMEITQGRVGIAGAGGNPALGTSSTLGMRIGSFPRIAVTPRVNVSKIRLPAASARSGDDVDAWVPVVGIDGAVGIYQGLSLFPTVGGFGSIDAVANLGRVLLPGGDGFSDGVTTWAIGAQVGILRESFTVPGITVTGMYRSLGDVEFGDPQLAETEGSFELNDLTAWSTRATIGKRFLLFSATAGVGYDWYSSDASLRYATDDPATDGTRTVKANDYSSERLTAFGNLAFTVVIVSLVGEVGWQQGASGFTGPGATDLLEKDGWYGSLGLRLTF
ncbi:MAG: hypothetical protein ACYC28_15085 [Longimicrobiales bacterium]